MTDQPTRPDPTIESINEADRHAERAAEVAHQGHDGYGSDDRAGYAGIAQVHATLALQAEVRAMRVSLTDVLGDILAALETRAAEHDHSSAEEDTRNTHRVADEDEMDPATTAVIRWLGNDDRLAEDARFWAGIDGAARNSTYPLMREHVTAVLRRAGTPLDEGVEWQAVGDFLLCT